MAGYFNNTYVSSAGMIGNDKISVRTFLCSSGEFFLAKFVSKGFWGVGPKGWRLDVKCFNKALQRESQFHFTGTLKPV